MSKNKSHNLNFSEEEKTGKKAERLSADISKAKHDVKPKKEMKVKQNLKFEEDKPKPSGKFKISAKEEIKDTPRRIVSGNIHNKVTEDADDNSSVEAANEGSKLIEDSAHRVRTYERKQNRNVSDESSKKDQEKKEMKDERKADKSEIEKRYNEYLESKPEGSSNPYSKWKQKQDIKKEYYASKSKGSAASETASTVKTKAKSAAEKAKEKATDFVKENKAAFIVVGGVLLALVLGMSLLGSTGGVIASSGSGVISTTTYPSEDAEMLNAETYYKNLETQLQSTISSYESTHSYDEYHYTIDEISHDPYELTSLLTAYSEGAYLANEVQTLERQIYAKQYVLSQRVVTKTKYRYETRYRLVTVTNADGSTSSYLESYTVRVSYKYYVCYVTLKNNGIENAAKSLLTSDQIDMYEIYNTTKGNREDLF